MTVQRDYLTHEQSKISVLSNMKESMSALPKTNLDTRTEILRISAELFARRGFTRTSISDITQELGMTKGALYFHFESKSALAFEIAQAYFKAWQPILDTVENKGQRGIEALQAISVAVAVEYRDNVLIQAAVRLFNEANEIDTEMPVPFVDWIDLVEGKLREEVEDNGVSSSLEVAETASFLVAAFFGIQDISNQLSGRTDIVRRVEVMWRLVLPGIQQSAGCS